MKLICLALVVVTTLAGLGAKVGSAQFSSAPTSALDARAQWVSAEQYRDCTHRAGGMSALNATSQIGLASCKKAWLLGSR